MAMTISGDNGLTFPAGSTQVQAGNFQTMVNRIINGRMEIDQRNAGASVTPTTDSTYTLDRWQTRLSASSKFSVQQNAGSVTPPTGFKNYLGITSLSSYSVGTNDFFDVNQRIEGFNFADLDWGTANAKTVTLSFWVRSSLTGTFGGALANSDSSRTYPYSYTISSANTWEQKFVIIAGDTSGTWLTTNGIGLKVAFGLGVGSTYSGTAGSWSSTQYLSATGATSVVGTNGATFYITGVDLRVGSYTVVPQDFRPYGTELQLCQRYLYAIDSNGLTGGAASSGSRVWINIAYPTRMRAAPTASVTGTIQISDNNTADYSAAATIVAHQGTNVGSRINLDNFTGLTAGRFYAGYTTGTPSGQLFYSAEL